MQHPTVTTLAAYVDGELQRSAATQIKQHLLRCPRCRAEQAELLALTGKLQEFALPEGLAEDLWERVRQQLPERRADPQPSSARFLRWLPPIGLAASSLALQAVLIVALGLWALTGLGWFDAQMLVTGWVPSTVKLPSVPLGDAASYILSWLLAAPLGPGLITLTQATGVDFTQLLSWLAPSALVLVAFGTLAVLYLGWLLVYWNRSARRTDLAAHAA